MWLGQRFIALKAKKIPGYDPGVTVHAVLYGRVPVKGLGEKQRNHTHMIAWSRFHILLLLPVPIMHDNYCAA